MRIFLLLTTLAAAGVNEPGSTTGSGYGPGMMGYGSDNAGDRPGQDSRSNRRCWNETDSERGDGSRAPCSK